MSVNQNEMLSERPNEGTITEKDGTIIIKGVMKKVVGPDGTVIEVPDFQETLRRAIDKVQGPNEVPNIILRK